MNSHTRLAYIKLYIFATRVTNWVKGLSLVPPALMIYILTYLTDPFFLLYFLFFPPSLLIFSSSWPSLSSTSLTLLFHHFCFISSDFLRYWGYRLTPARSSWSLPLDSETRIMPPLVCGISPSLCFLSLAYKPHIHLSNSVSGWREEKGALKINKKALHPSLIPPTGHLTDTQRPSSLFLLSLLASVLSRDPP